jgi:hypothetical protein
MEFYLAALSRESDYEPRESEFGFDLQEYESTAQEIIGVICLLGLFILMFLGFCHLYKLMNSFTR